MKKIWIALYPLAAGFVFVGIMGIFAFTDEMRPQGDSVLSLFCVLAALVSFPLMMLIIGAWSIISLFQRKWKEAILLLACTLATPALPLCTTKITAPLSKAAQIRYIDRFGRDELRTQAAELIKSSESIRGSYGYFGKNIPHDYLPDKLRGFSRGDGVEVSSKGVVYTTDGLGSWRGGYMITPTGSDYEPTGPGSRKILDGFFYVIAK